MASALINPPTSLIQVAEAKRLLASAKSVDGVLQIRDQAAAVAAYLQQQADSRDAANDAAEIKLRAERRLGELLAGTVAPGGRSKSHRATSIRGGSSKPLPSGVTRSDSSRWQREASVPDDAFEAYLADRRQDGVEGEITSAGLLKLAGGGRIANWSSESVEWYTPPRYIEAARAALGAIDLDPASSEAANATIRADQFFTREQDGLKRPWPGRVWLNPPYGEEGTDRWVEKTVAEYVAKRTRAAVLLVNAVTDRKWFAPLFEFPICFTDHRIEFYTPTGHPRSPVSGNAFVYLGPHVARFADVFRAFGAVVGKL